jgi:hypothetical protein
MAEQPAGMLSAPFGTLPESDDHRKGNNNET